VREEARRTLIALVLGLTACGSPPSPATPAPAPTPAPPVDAGPPPDPAMAEILTALRAQRDRACACTDAACAEDAEVAQLEWGMQHRELLDRSHPTPAQDAEADALVHEAEACADRFQPAH
jgi:hypothetical protein